MSQEVIDQIEARRVALAPAAPKPAESAGGGPDGSDDVAGSVSSADQGVDGAPGGGKPAPAATPSPKPSPAAAVPAPKAGEPAPVPAPAAPEVDIAALAPAVLRRLDDGLVEVDVRKLPANVRFRLGDTDKDTFSREDFDYRYRQNSIRLEKLAEERKAVEAERQRMTLPDGRSKVDAYDKFDEEVQTDPVGLAAKILAKADPRAWNALRGAFNALRQGGLYDPNAARASKAERALQRATEQQKQAAQAAEEEQVIAQARAYLEEQTGREIGPDEWEAVEDHYLALSKAHEAAPERWPKPTLMMAYESAQRQAAGHPQAGQPAPAQPTPPKPKPAASATPVPKPRSERPNTAVGGSGPAQSALEMIESRRRRLGATA